MKDQTKDDVDLAWFADDLLEATTSKTRGHVEAISSIATFEREVAASVDPRRRAVLCYEIGRLHEVELGDDHRAVSFYQRAFRYDPTHLATLQAGRRVFARAGRWAMVLRLIDAEVRAHPSRAHRGRLLRQKGEIYLLRHKKDPEAARTSFDGALRLAPMDAAAGRGLSAISEALDDPGLKRRGIEAAVEAAETSALKVALLCDGAIGSLVGREEAVDLLEAALRLAPTSPEILRALALARLEAGDLDGFVAMAYRAAQSVEDPSARACQLEELATEALAAGADPRLVDEVLEAAAEVDVTGTHALDLLATERQRRGAYAEAADALQRLVGRLSEAERRAGPLWTLTDLYEFRLGDKVGAIRCLRMLIDDNPSWSPAYGRLSQLLAERGAWPELVAVFKAELEMMVDPEERLRQALRIGELCEGRLEDLEGAADAYAEVLRLRPSFAFAAHALERVLIRLEAWPDVVALYELELERRAADEDKIYLLERMAAACHERLGLPDRAMEVWRRLLTIRPHHLGALRALGALCLTFERYEELLDLLDVEVTLTDDVALRLTLLARCVGLSERSLGDDARAVDYIERALTLDPASLPAMQAYGRLLHRQGDWAGLAGLYRREIEQREGVAGRAALYYKLGALLRDRLNAPDRAMEAFKAAVALAPEHLAALRSIRQLAWAGGRRADVAELLELEITQLRSEGAKAEACLQLGHLYTDVLARPELATESWLRAAGPTPAGVRALRALVQHHGALGDHEAQGRALLALVEASADPETRTRWGLALAQLYAGPLRAPEEAMKAYQRVLDADPQGPGVLKALLAMERLSLAGGDVEALVAVYGQLIERTEGVDRANFYLQRGHLRDVFLRDPAGALRDHLAALEASPSSVQALEWVETRAAEAGDVGLLAKVLQRRLQVAAAPAERAMVLLRAGQALRKHGALSEAVECLEALLQIDPGAPVALRVLRQTYRDLGDEVGLLRLTEAAGRHAQDPSRASSLLREAGAVREELGPSQGALDDYLAAVEANPKDEVALAAVRRLCERSGRWEALVCALEGRISKLSRHQIQASLEVADLYLRRLDRPDEAARILSETLVRVPTQAPVLQRRLGDLYAELEQWREALVHYERLRDVVPDPEMSRAVTFRMAAIYEDKLAEPAHALETLRRTLRGGEGDRGALKRIADLAAAHVSGARQALSDGLAACLMTEAVYPLWRRLAGLQMVAGEPEAAIECLEHLFDAVPEADVDLFEALALARWAAGDQRGGLMALAEAATLVVAADDAARIFRLLGEWALARGDVGAALIDLRTGVERAPDDWSLRRILAETAERGGAPAVALDAYRWLVQHEPLDTMPLEGLVRNLPEEETEHLERLLFVLSQEAPSEVRLPAPIEPLPRSVFTGLNGTGAHRRVLEHLVVTSEALPEVFCPDLEAGLHDDDIQRALVRLNVGFDLPAEDLACPMLRAGLGECSVGVRDFELSVRLYLRRSGWLALSRWSPAALDVTLGALCALAGHTVPARLGLGVVQAQAEALRLAYEPVAARLDATLAALVKHLETGEDLTLVRAEVEAEAHRAATLVVGVGPAVGALRWAQARQGATDEAPEGLLSLTRWIASAAYLPLHVMVQATR